MLCATAVAAHDFEMGGIYYNILSEEDKTVEVTYKGTSYNEYSNEYTGGVVIPQSVTYNGSTYSVTSIRSYAFSGCSGLTSVVIPNSVTSIGIYAFKGCTGLTSVEFNAENCATMGSSSYPVFDGCTALSTVTIGENVKNIPEYAFCGCSGLTSVVIPNSVTSIEEYAFNGCINLANVEIPNSVTSIGDYAFYYCTGLTSITIPNSVTSIGYYTFNNTAWYNNQPDGVVYAGKVLYKYKGTMPENTSIIVKDGTLGFADAAFINCSGLTSVIIPNSVTSIRRRAFKGCSGLTNVIIGNSVTKIEDNAFEDCSGLTSITIPNSVTIIGNSAFIGCKGLTCVTIGNGVIRIGSAAFQNCNSLASIISYIPADKLFHFTYNAFYGLYKDCVLYVPYGAKVSYEASSSWGQFFNIVELEPVTEVTVTINQYASATYCSEYALDFSNVEGLKAYAATGYKSNSQVVTLTRVQTSKPGFGLFLKGEPGEYVVPVIESTDEHSLNMLVGTLEPTIVNSTDGAMSNYKFTIADGDTAPMFYPFEDNTTFSAGKAYLQIPTAWLPVTAQKSLNIRFDEGETTDIDELEGENGEVKTVYDLQGRVVENPTSGIYIINGKKVVIR